MALLLPIGIKTFPGAGNNPFEKTAVSALQSFVTYFFVNPEKMQLKRNASIAEARTMGGTVFQPWPNIPDEIEFSGIFYGTRSLLEAFILSKAIPESPDRKEVELIYKWKKHKGFIKGITISADAERPRVFNYSFTFVSKDAIDLYRLMLGQLTGTTAEASFLAAQSQAASDAVKSEALNTLSVAVAAGTGEMDPHEIAGAATRAAVLYLLGNAMKVGKRRMGSF